MKPTNESPVGLATIVMLFPGVVATIVFVYLLVKNGDVEGANQAAAAVIALLSFATTGVSRNVRAGQPPNDQVTGEELLGGKALPPGSEHEEG